MIQSFANSSTEKIFLGEELSRKELRKLGDLNLEKAQQRLLILNDATEKNLLLLPFLHYHKLQGSDRYSIDADSRKSRWRITFSWADQQLTDVEFVTIEDTH